MIYDKNGSPVRTGIKQKKLYRHVIQRRLLNILTDRLQNRQCIRIRKLE